MCHPMLEARDERALLRPSTNFQYALNRESMECTFLLGSSQATRLLQSSERQAQFSFLYLTPVISAFRKLYLQKMDFRGNRKTLLVF